MSSPASRFRVFGLFTAALLACGGDNSTSVATGELQGTLTSSLGGPLAGVSIRVAAVDGPSPSSVTDEAGYYHLTGVPAGTGSLLLQQVPTQCTVSSTPFRYQVAANTATTLDLTLTCVPAVGTIHGVVTSAVKGEVAYVPLTIQVSAPDTTWFVYANFAGEYTFSNVPAGSGTVTITNLGRPECTTVTVPYIIPAHQAVVELPITRPCVPPIGSVAGTVVSSEGDRYAGVALTLTRLGDTTGTTRTATTDAQGAYRFDAVPGGDVSLLLTTVPVHCTALEATGSQPVVHGKETRIDITMPCHSTGTVMGRVFRSFGGGVYRPIVSINRPDQQYYGSNIGTDTGSYVLTGVPRGTVVVRMADGTMGGQGYYCGPDSVQAPRALGAGLADTLKVDLTVPCYGDLVVRSYRSSTRASLTSSSTLVVTQHGGIQDGSRVVYPANQWVIRGLASDSGAFYLAGLPSECQQRTDSMTYAGLHATSALNLDVVVRCAGTLMVTVTNSGVAVPGTQVTFVPSSVQSTAVSGTTDINGRVLLQPRDGTDLGTITVVPPTTCDTPAPTSVTGLTTIAQTTRTISLVCH